MRVAAVTALASMVGLGFKGIVGCLQGDREGDGENDCEYLDFFHGSIGLF